MGVLSRLWRTVRARCARCGEAGGSCIESDLVDEAGTRFSAVPVHRALVRLHACLEALDLPRVDDAVPRRCNGCGAPTGGFHHEGCVEERCPRCRDALCFCDCFVDQPGDEGDASDLRRLGHALEWLSVALRIESLPRRFQGEALNAIMLERDDALIRAPRPAVSADPDALYGEEMRRFEEATWAEPENADAWLGLAEATRRSGQPERARRGYERALDLDPDRVAAGVGLAATENDLGRPLHGLVASEAACDRDPGSPGAWFERGRSLHLLGRLPAAVEAFERVIELEPSNMGAWKMRGICQRGVRRVRHAMGLGRSAPAPLILDSDVEPAPIAAERWGVSVAVATLAVEAAERIGAGDVEGALARLADAIEQADTFAWGWRTRARCLQFVGRHPEAIADYRRAFELDGRPEDLEGIGHCQHAVGDTTAALASFDRAIAAAPTLVDAWFGRSLALEASGRPEAAMAAYDRFLELSADGATARSDRARARDIEARRRLAKSKSH